MNRGNSRIGRGLVAALVVASASAVGTGGDDAQAASTGRTAMVAIGRAPALAPVVDSANGRVFVAQPSSNSIAVTSLDGDALRRVSIPLPFDAVLSPDGLTLYVASSEDGIVALDTSTLTVRQRWDADGVCPSNLALAARRVWFWSSCSGPPTILSLDPSHAGAPFVDTGYRVDGGALEGAAWDSEVLIAADWWTSPGTLAMLRVTSSGGLTEVAVREDDMIWQAGVSADGRYVTSTWSDIGDPSMALSLYELPNLTSPARTYPFYRPVAATVTPDGSHVVAGAVRTTTEDGIAVWPRDEPGTRVFDTRETQPEHAALATTTTGDHVVVVHRLDETGDELYVSVYATGIPPAQRTPPPASSGGGGGGAGGGGGGGYWMVDRGGHVYAFGSAAWHGNAPVGAVAAVDLERHRTGAGYWIVDAAGHVFAFGAAPYLGNAVDLRPGESVASLSGTRSGAGYWLFTTHGRALAFGDAPHLGDMAGTSLNGPVLDSIPTPSGRGYYLVAADGGIFTFGDAAFRGSMGSTKLNAPVQSLVPDPDGAGYWLVAADGGVFTFEADFHGSMGSTRLNRPVVGMVGSPDGYLMVAEDGGIFTFGDAPFLGSLGDSPPAQPVVSVATV